MKWVYSHNRNKTEENELKNEERKLNGNWKFNTNYWNWSSMIIISLIIYFNRIVFLWLEYIKFYGISLFCKWVCAERKLKGKNYNLNFYAIRPLECGSSSYLTPFASWGLAMPGREWKWIDIQPKRKYILIIFCII